LSKVKFLADVNVLIALLDEGHIHHRIVASWFEASAQQEFGVCAFTEAGFLRVTTSPKVGLNSIEEALDALASLNNHAGYRFWPMAEGWTALTEPFRERVFGHQQITDAYLLGLAVREGGVLVTLDKGIQFLAGAKYGENVLVLG
jgi:toxin-antitoxin system PIN domain toxin